MIVIIPPQSIQRPPRTPRHYVRWLVLLFCLAVASMATAQTPDNGPAGEPGAVKDPKLHTVPETPGMPRVLLIGDSISEGYTPLVRQMLEGKANVQRAFENSGPSSLGVKNLDAWLKVGTPEGQPARKWDVIHFNFGLHDLKIMHGTPPDATYEVPPADYEKNLRELAQRMKATGARLIWASTTPIPDGPLRPPRMASDVPRYNEIAARVMGDNLIPIDDLYALILPRQAQLQVKGNVHFKPDGYKVLAGQVAAAIEKALPKP